MKILVTGGTGFIGSNIVRALTIEGHDIVITGHDAEQALPNFRGKYLQPSFIGLDFDSIGHVDAVFHEAAINATTFLDAREMQRANVESSRRLFEYVVQNGCRRIVYASSTAVYGDVPAPYREDGPMRPLNPYGESKKALDEFAVEFSRQHPDVVVVGLRYCNVYGSGEEHKGKRASMIFQLARQMARGNPRIFRDGEQKRDYIYVKDVVHANILALKAEESCIVNCGSGAAVSFNEVIRILNEVLGLSRTPEYFENPFAARYQNHTECDMSAAAAKLGFVPQYDIRKGIADYFASGALVERNT